MKVGKVALLKYNFINVFSKMSFKFIVFSGSVLQRVNAVLAAVVCCVLNAAELNI